jgi:type II secretory pathway predicted ATPase ExeA
LLLQLLAAGFRGQFRVALLNSSQLCTRKALLQSILFELKLPYRDMDEGELRLSLIQHLEPQSDDSQGLLLLVDEAHALPLRLLEEIRQLTNIVRDGQPRVRLILAGSSALEERIASPKLESFQQRLSTRCYLQPLTRDESLHYVGEQLHHCGGRAASLFTQDALEAIFTATDGVPRLINQLCDHALVLAALGGHRELNAEGIEEAWADLQQLPLPWNEKNIAAPVETGSIIEFGALEEPGLNVTGPLPDMLRGDAVRSATILMDQIDEEIASLDLPDGELARDLSKSQQAQSFSPLSAHQTEVEVTFRSADPFGQGFDDEEVVIDKYASLEAAAMRSRPRVKCEEGREIAAALYRAEEVQGLEPPQIARSESSSFVQPMIVSAPQIRDDFVLPERAAPPVIKKAIAVEASPAAADPVYPEPIVAEIAPRATLPLKDFGDDRDLIIVEDEPKRKAHVPPGKPKKQDYRQLFSTLRRG